MKDDPSRPHRQSIRLKGYDYSQPGAYFITISTFNKECFFGHVQGDRITLSPAGEIASGFWRAIPKHFKKIELDEFIVMPNHIHGVIIITESGRGVKFNAPTVNRNYFSRISPQYGSISVIIRTYKSAVSHWCKQNGYEYFQWQRNYYEHVVRNEEDLAQIRETIVGNPLK